MSRVGTFALGFVGSVVVEIALVGRVYYQEPIHFPERYRRWDFYLFRTVLALIGGGLAVFYGLENPFAAINVGAATPAIISAFAREPPKP